MREEELRYYLESNKTIRITLKNNFRYTGKIVKLFFDSFRFKDRFEGVITIPYEEIRLITESLGGKNGK